MSDIGQGFSVLISCYRKDSPTQLEEALESISVQTLPATEVVLVEDGPLTEELYLVLAEYEKKLPLIRVPLETNVGLGGSLNQGLSICKYDLVLRMDTDDICDPDRFKIQVSFLQGNPEVDIVGSWAKDINNAGEVIGDRTYPVSHDELYRIMWTNPIIHPAVAYRKTSIMKVGSYRPEVKRRQDYELWMRAAAQGLKFANIPEYLLYYRFTDNYYKKNNTKVAFKQALMGYRGAKQLKLPFYTRIAVFAPVLRSLLPKGLIGPVHRLMSKFDPRK